MTDRRRPPSAGEQLAGGFLGCTAMFVIGSLFFFGFMLLFIPVGGSAVVGVGMILGASLFIWIGWQRRQEAIQYERQERSESPQGGVQSSTLHTRPTKQSNNPVDAFLSVGQPASDEPSVDGDVEPSDLDSLSDNALDVMEILHMSGGATFLQIAEELSISEKDVSEAIHEIEQVVPVARIRGGVYHLVSSPETTEEAAGGEESSADESHSPAGHDPIAERLHRLDALHNQGTISEEEYAEQRNRIISDL